MSSHADGLEWAEGTMTVGDFIDQLSQYPRDLHLVLSKDAEGNGYSPLISHDPVIYRKDSDYSGSVLASKGEVVYEFLDDKEGLVDTPFEGIDPDNNDPIPPNEANAIALWPLN